ncbi:MAG: hypothetical protein ABI780_04610 [Ardenticatenales bacterium]
MAGRTAPRPTRRASRNADAAPRSSFVARQLIVAFVLCSAITAAMPFRPAGVRAQVNIDQFVSACANNGSDPWLVTSAFPKGSSGDDQAAIVAFHNSNNNRDHISLATAAQIGASYGLAFDRSKAVLYAGAFHKRGTHFGPAGPGGVYALDLKSGQVRTFATVPNAGADVHAATADYFPDINARTPVGKTSLGDVELSADGAELAVMNLNDRKIYRFKTSDASLLGSFSHGAVNEPWAADARPFGLGWHDGRLYHGVVNSAQSTRRSGDLQARVYSSHADGSDMKLETRTILAFNRGAIWPGDGEAEWQVWRDPPGNVTNNDHGRYPQPLLADIDFTANGDQMILGFRDRFGDQAFYTTPPNQPPRGERIYNTPAGDILPAFRKNGAWEVQISPEYYSGDYSPQPDNHQESSFGGLAVIPWANRVVMSGNSPERISSAGLTWLSTGGGDALAREEIYVFGRGDNFGKANGLGDVELLCPDQQVTATPVPSDTPTATATVPTATATSTVTPTLTATVTASTAVTSTPTMTVSSTPTMTVTETATTVPTATVVMTVTVMISESTPVVVTVTPPPDTPRPPDTATPPEKHEEHKEEHHDTPQQPTPEIAVPTPFPGLPRAGGGGASRLRFRGRYAGDASWLLTLLCVGLVAARRRRWRGVRIGIK